MSEIDTQEETRLADCEQPVVFRDALSSWGCSTWTLSDWAARTQNVPLKFRVGVKAETGEPQWETEGAQVSATMQQFTQWTSGCNDQQSELASVDALTHFAYSSYNYMSKVFQDLPSITESVDWKVFGFPGRKGKDSTMWLGSEGSNTPCHQDTYGYNMVAQLIGKKSWTMFPAKDSRCLYPTRIPFEESSIFSLVNFREVDFVKFPKLKSTRPYYVVLEPGDVLLVPHHWWHYVSCLTTALSINTWIPMSADRDSQLLEAITRTLATGLVPCYEDDDQWVNTNEELTTPEQNLAYLRSLLRPNFTDDAVLPDCTSEATQLPFMLVPQYSWANYATTAGCRILQGGSDSTKRPSAGQDCLSSRRIMNCFLDPEVVELVARKLRELAN